MPRSVRGQISVILNGALLVVFLLFLAYDYRNDMEERLNLKRIGLEEQARILLMTLESRAAREEPARHLAEIRRYLNDLHSDSHLVAARINGTLYQSGLTPEDETILARGLQDHSSQQIVQIQGRGFLIGRQEKQDTTVYVGEDVEGIRTVISSHLERQLIGVFVTLLFGIILLNGVLWLAVVRPLSTLTNAVGEIGTGKLGLQINPMGPLEFDILATEINNMSRSLAEVEHARSVQMQKARAIQDSLQPIRMQLSGAAIAHHYQPAESVGGDYYDLLQLPDSSGLFCIADVTGHGVSAALVAAMVKFCLLNAVEHSLEPGDILGFVNRRLNSMDLPGMFVSMFLVRFRPDSATLQYAGAGHPPALVADGQGRCHELQSTGPLLGIGADFDWNTETTPFASGDRLLLYTDGVTEASSGQGELLGLGRLQEIIRATRETPPTEAVQNIVQRVVEYCSPQPFPDDLTLLVVHRH